MLPTEYGTPRKLWFLLQPTYWFPHSARKLNYNNFTSITTEDISPTTETDCLPEFATTDTTNNEYSNPNIETLTMDQRDRVRVVITGLQKRYSDGKLAVKKLDLAMIEGQITCLLGHNGAGTTYIFYVFYIILYM